MQGNDFASIKLLQDGKRDARFLLTLWFVKKTFWPLVIIGITMGIVTHTIKDGKVELTDPGSVITSLFSPLAALVLAVIVRISVDVLAGFAAYPVVHERLRELSALKRGYAPANILDTWRIVKGVKTLRWTHHVRKNAATRLQKDFVARGVLDRVFDLVTIVLLIVLIMTTLFVGV